MTIKSKYGQKNFSYVKLKGVNPENIPTTNKDEQRVK